MRKIIFKDPDKIRTSKTKRWLGWLTFCMMMFVGQMGFAQIDYTYDWEPTGMGSWTTSGSGSFSRNTTTPCTGSASARANNWYGNESFLVSPALTGTNGDDLTVSFNYKVTNYNSNSTGASAANFGEVRVEWASSTSGPWTVAYTITSADHIVSSSCANKSVTFSGLPSSGDVYVRFVAKSGNSNADNYAYFDDVVITQGPPPTCPAPSALTASNPTLTSIDLSWDGVGGASGNYEIKWGAPGFDIDAATAIPVTGLTYTLAGTAGSYEFVVREICSVNDASAWSSRKAFRIPNVGDDCSAPIVIGALPYTTTDDTANYTDNPSIEGTPGGCGTTSAYLNGNDVVYAYTADFDGVIAVSLDPSVNYAGIFAYTSCEDIGEECIASAYNGFSSAVVSFELNVTNGETYYFVISTWADPQTVGYTLDISQVLCPKPTGVAHTDVTHNSANVSWDVSGDYEINWGPSSPTFTAGDGVNTNTVNATTEFAFSGLNGTTTYRYFVRQNCAGTDGDSEWVGPFTFTTLVAPASIPWLEPFTGTTFPTGWANTSSWSVSTSTTLVPGAEGSYLYKNIFGTTGTNGAMFSTLRMGLVSAGDILNFNYGLRKAGTTYTASGTISIEVSTDNGVTYSPFQTITHSDDVAWTSSEQFDLSAYAGENIRIRITAKRTGSTDDYYLGFDNFYVGQPITCEAPSALTATNITTNTADLSWTSEGSTFDISWGTGAFDAEDGTIVALANGGTLSGLTAQTTYQYYVRQNCGVGDVSMWVGPFSFTTLCDTVTEFTQDWDSVTTPALPTCYTKVGSLGSVYTQSSNASSGSNTLYMYGSSASNEPTLALQQVSNAGAGTHWLRFKLRTNFTVGGKLQVGYLTDPTDAASFVMLEEFIADSTTYTEHTCAPGTAMGSYTTLALRAKGTPANSMLIDDLSWEIVPSCLAPTSLTASDITANAANLSWSSEGSLFDIEWAEGTFDQGSGTLVSSVANPHTLGGLMPNTTYSYYVRQDCTGEASDWSGPYSFTTACEAFDLPYSQDFEGVTAPSLPSCTSIETLNGNPWRTSSSAVTGMTGNKLNYPWHASGTGTADAWFYTPGLNLEAGKNYAISYKYGNNNTYYTESMRVAYGTSAMASVMNEVLADHNAINSTGVSENEVFFTVAEDGVYYFGFQSYSIANQNQLYVDDILIRELGDDCTGTPDAGIATASMSSGESGSAVDFAVTGYENDTEGISYDWEYSVDNGVTWNSTVTSDNEVTFTITGTIGTVFQVRYAATCSFSGLIGYSNIVTFTVTQPLNYCTPTYTDFTYDDRLSVVTTTGAVSNLNYSNSIRSQHFDETATILEATPGMQFTLNTTYVGGGQTVGVWIDWENNNTFDDLGNRIALNYSGSAGQTFTVTIPSDATLGDYRLRVRGSYDDHVVDGDAFACNSKYYGSSVDFTIRIAAPCSSEWTGFVNTDWNNPANWCDNTVPTAGSDVVINVANAAVISTDVSIASITLGAAANVTVNGSLNVGDISVAAGGSLIVANDANLFQSETAVNSGNIIVKRNAVIKHLDYTIWSSPVVGQGLQAFSPNTLASRIYDYNTTTDTWQITTGNFIAGKGVMFRAPNLFDDGYYPNAYTYQGTFTGTPHNGDITMNFAQAGTYQGVGNPYPSNLDLEEFWMVNSGTGEGTVYLWTNTNAWDAVAGDYLAMNWATHSGAGGIAAANSTKVPESSVPVGQGFVIEATGLNSVSFNNDMRTAQSGVFFRTAVQDKHRLWLNLSNTSNELNNLLIGYMDGATQGEDLGIDSKMFNYEGSALYSLIDGSQSAYVIQGRSLPFDDFDVVPLGFRATTSGSFTISLSNFDGVFAEGQDIFLKDNLTQTEHNLKDGAYTFVSNQGEFATRFEVVYRSSMDVNVPELDNAWVVYAKDKTFFIETQGLDMKEVVMYDMLGRVVYQSKAEGNSHAIAQTGANQVLIIKVTTVDNQVLTKKVNN